jgi:hypothetical protein
MVTSNADPAEDRVADGSIQLLRAGATIGLTIAPCSLGFVMIAVSKRLIRAIKVGDDPEMLVSDLQNQFPNDAIEVNENDPGLVAKVVDLIERLDQASGLPSTHGSAVSRFSAHGWSPRSFGTMCAETAHVESAMNHLANHRLSKKQ